MVQANPGSFITGAMRCIYPNVVEPRAHADGGSSKYSIKLLLAKGAADRYQCPNYLSYKAACDRAASQIIPGGTCTTLDGDMGSVQDGATSEIPELANFWLIGANRNGKFSPPILLNTDMVTPVEGGLFADGFPLKGGDYVRVLLKAYTPKSGKGAGKVFIGLETVVMAQRGEALGGGGGITESEAVAAFTQGATDQWDMGGGLPVDAPHAVGQPAGMGVPPHQQPAAGQQFGAPPPAGVPPAPQQFGAPPPAGVPPAPQQFGAPPPAGVPPAPQQFGAPPPAGVPPAPQQFGAPPPAGVPPVQDFNAPPPVAAAQPQPQPQPQQGAAPTFNAPPAYTQ